MFLSTLADRIADRLSARLDARLDEFEARVMATYERVDRRAAARILATKRGTPRAGTDASAIFDDPPVLNGSVLDVRRRLRGY